MDKVTIKPIKILTDKIGELPEDMKQIIENSKAEMKAVEAEAEDCPPATALHHMSEAGYLEYLMGYALEERPVEEAYKIAAELEKQVNKMKNKDYFIASL